MLNSLYIGNQDGGIISAINQVAQSEEPVVIVGLGGTGVDAISRLKTKLHRQIIPDNHAKVESDGVEPEYAHIKFLGIDADKNWLEGSGLTQAESLNIQNYTYNAIFAPDKLDALKKQKELQWMSIDYMSKHLPPNQDGAGAYRQFGRWLTVSSANKIKTALNQVILQACTGKPGDRLVVHIVSGISGGMGAGSFVDVCYIAQDILKGLGFTAAKVFGYFVLPDAIISKPDIVGNPIKTASNEKNGMASLLEIEHLMNLKDSNEWFEQDYGSFRIKSQEPLVHMCHFISSTNMNGVTVPNGYEYALNVIGDYILAFISKEMVADGETPITMTGNLANITADLSGTDPEHGRGYSQNYHILGSANAEIPTTQMATYLASELFKKLTIAKKMPDNLVIEQEFADYLKLSDSRIKQLENQLGQGAPWIQITTELVRQYFDQIKSHMNDNVLPAGMINPTENSMKKRQGLLLEKRETLTKDVTAYVYQAGASSIPGLALNKLIEMATNPEKGPVYAYGMMNKTGADIFHYLDGRMKAYSKLKKDAKDQEAFFTDQEPNAKRDLGRAGMFSKGAKIEAYAAALNNIYYWQAQGDLYEQMEIMMSELIKIFRKMNNEYLKPLYEVTQELIETFDANASYFDIGKGDESQDGFTRQLVAFSRIKPDLDAEIMRLDPKAETGGLLDLLAAYPEIWMEREEARLKAKISEYVLAKFNTILAGSLESYLRRDLRMDTAPPATFAKAIQTQILQPFADQAAPIFWTNEPLVGDPTKTSHRSVLTVPSSANCVCKAAKDYAAGDKKIQVRKSLINDRIYILRTISGVPMHAYQGLLQYLGAYKSYSDLALHSYERDVDWRKILTFPYPYSYVPDYTKNAKELLALYNEAVDKGIIYFDGLKAYVKQLEDLDPDKVALDSVMTDGKLDMVKADERLKELEVMKESIKEPLEINSKGNKEGNSLVRDNFLRFYGIQQAVRAELKKLDQIEKAITEIENAKIASQAEGKLLKVFFDSLLGSLLTDDGFNVSYKYVSLYGRQEEVILCDNSMQFSGLTKYYQAFATLASCEAEVQDNLEQAANQKFNEMTNADKRAKLTELMSLYNPQVLAMISANLAGKLEQKTVDDFYAEFVKYMSLLDVQLRMIGA